MEYFRLAQSEQTQALSGLQSEWLENQNAKQSGGSKELAMVLSKFETPQGPGKDVADRLDRELKDFAESKIPNVSKEMQAFQKMIGEFCSESDKKKAMEKLGDSYSRLRVQLGKDIGTTYEEMEAEGARQPGRKELDEDFQKKLSQFFDKLDTLPFQEKMKVYDLLEWDGENKNEHQAKVREGLKDKKDLLYAYNRMEDASDKIDANKSEREKELEALYKRQLKDYRAMPKVVEKAYIRSEINY